MNFQLVFILFNVLSAQIKKSSQQRINACTIGNNPCSEIAECYVETLLIGAPKCKCPHGFEGDGLLNGTGCRDVDECQLGIHNCNLNTQRCINTVGSYDCECLSGYRRHEHRQNECIDIDECMELSVCPSSTLCINTEGSFKCECLDRDLIFDQGRCRPINKCKDYNGRLNDCSQICVSETEERGKCECMDGYKLHEDGKTCIDINECLVNNPCDLSISTCINTPGSYICDCFKSAGYITSPYNSKICINVNECEEDPMICGDLNMCCKDLAPPDKYECAPPILGIDYENEIESSEGSIEYERNTENIENKLNEEYSKNAKPIRNTKKRKEMNNQQSNQNMNINDNYLHGCYESDVEYPGYTLQVLQSLATAFDCQLQCQIDLGCDYFTYDMLSRVCFFKAAKSEIKESPGMISGPKYCSNKKFYSRLKSLNSDSFSYSSASLLRRMSSNNIPNKTIQNNEYKCPMGYKYAQEIWRKQKNKKTMEVLQKQFGSRPINTINPQDISEGIQSNANFMAKQINHWYDALSNVPNTFGNVTRQPTQVKPSLDSSNINPGFIAGGIPPPPRTGFGGNAMYYSSQPPIENEQTRYQYSPPMLAYGMNLDNSDKTK